MLGISNKAIIEEGAQLAPDVRVGAFSYVGPQVRIARGCVIENNVTLTGRTSIGERSHVFPLTIIGTGPDGQDGPCECVVGEANVIRELVAVYGSPERPTRVGVDNLIMTGSVVGAGAAIGDHGIFANCTHICEGAVVENYVRTSAFPVIEPGVRVGAYTFVNGYAGVDHDVPPFAIVEGSPVRVRGVNAENLKRCGFGDRDIRALKEAFRDLYNGTAGQANPKALAKLLGEAELNPYVRRLAEALRPAAGGGGGGDHA
jgi:UDP-N-acetylglucosamine acyltransferase